MKKILFSVALIAITTTAFASDDCVYASKPVKQGDIVISNADTAHLCVYSETLAHPVFATLDGDFSHLLSDDQKLMLKGAAIKPAVVEPSQVSDHEDKDSTDYSYIFDSEIEAIRAPVAMAIDDNETVGVIFVNKYRPTSISFFDAKNKPLQIDFVTSANDSRFSFHPAGDYRNSLVIITNKAKGAAKIEVFFKGVPFSVPFTIEAGDKHHFAAKGVLMNGTSKFLPAPTLQ